MQVPALATGIKTATGVAASTSSKNIYNEIEKRIAQVTD
ncbi:unnamed protein product, partial [Rotaria sp. Silwood2]